ncbi:MAG: ferrochelatase [Pasteurellaceae bacterium]|nr:ferrochelatase [Pasteurellaceae bacterium]
MKKQKIGVLLANLGTPDEPQPNAVRRYLKQFLSDPRVVDLPDWRWQPILNLLILPRRSQRVAKVYQQVWTEQGSPLLAISRQQQQALQQYLDTQSDEFIVELGMTYGSPSMQSAIDNLQAKQVEKIIVLPLYPQYSSTTTGAVFDAFAHALKNQRAILPFDFIHSYHLDSHYIQALANSIQERLKTDEFLLFSFHGIPVRYEQEGDFYRQHCIQTAQAVADKLELTDKQWTVTFQSRFGKEEWLQPYTNEFMQQAAQQDIRQIAVICPGFSADCIETLEEIGIENRDYFINHGGRMFQYIPALNASPDHIQMMAQLILARTQI